VRPIDGAGYRRTPEAEACEVSNTCKKDCLCYSEDSEEAEGGAWFREEEEVRRGKVRCDCTDKHCLAGIGLYFIQHLTLSFSLI